MNLGIVATIGYGVLTIFGGIIGYQRARSQASLVSGGISGFLLLVSAIVQWQGQSWGLIFAALLTAFLIIFFLIRLGRTRKFMPAGVMVILGVVALMMMGYQLLSAS